MNLINAWKETAAATQRKRPQEIQIDLYNERAAKVGMCRSGLGVGCGERATADQMRPWARRLLASPDPQPP